jgi:hypothetical protein
MKAQILKLAGVKTDKEFYKLFPSEEAFMKVHGKAFKKAQMGTAINKAQGGTTLDNNNNGIPDYLESSQGVQGASSFNPGNTFMPSGINTPSAMGAANQMLTPTNPFALSNAGNTWASNNPLPQGVTDTSVPSDIGYNAPQASGAFDIMPYAQAATSVFGGIKALGAQKKALKEARMWNKITGLQARAAESVDVDANRPKNYVRPEDNPVQPGQLFPSYGVGTNVLKRNGGPIRAAYGAEIQNTYAPNTLYDDLGYEPLNDSDNVKQYYHGGNIQQMQAGGFMNFMGEQGGAQALGMLSGAMNDNSGGSQIGSGLGTAAGTAFGGPVGGMIGGALGSMVGGALDKSASKMKKEQRGIQRNQDRIMGSQFAQGVQNQYGSYMEEGGQLTNPQLITRFGELDQQDFYDYAHEGMNSLRAGGHLREYTPISERGMEQYAMGGEVKTTWGGHAETISRNPYMPGTGETIMFRGKSHDESDGNGNTGIGVKYGKGKHDSYTDYAEYGSQNADADVEVERGEPAAELQDPNGEKNLTVYGNLKIPNQYLPLLNDPRAKGKKFKNYINEISKDEAKQTKLIDKSTNQLNDLDVRSSFDKLKFDALSSSIKGANMKLKDIADKKKNAAYLQNAINDTAEEHGLVADDLARGKVKVNKEALQEYAEYGTTIPKAKDGEKIKFNSVKEAEAKGFKKGKDGVWRKTTIVSKGNKKETKVAEAMVEIPKGQRQDSKTGLWGKVTQKEFEELKKNNPWYNWVGFDPKNEQQVLNFQETFNEKAKEVGSTSRITPDKRLGEQTASAKLDLNKKSEPAASTTEVAEVDEPDKTYKTTDYKRSKIMDIANMILPFIRPTDQEPLDPRQLSGEMYALSTNKVEPVQAQGFQPDLATPYDISLQDQMNEITAQTRAAQKMAQGNPAAQALIAGQAYDAINKVKGEEFRANQAMQAGVYNQNRAALNDAKLKNLDIYDRQYTRQEQAKSNTKAITQAALNSISDKYAKNKLENRELGVYENLYNYRYDPAGRAINMNPLYQPNMPTLYGKQDNPNMIPVYDPSGKRILKYISTTPEDTTTEVVEEDYYTPDETTESETSDYTPIETTTTGEDLSDVSDLPKKNGGKTKKKIAMNGSIVKMYKTV